ncbi:hypothetical protein ACQ4PT_006350 [Festuca glaucescens]
MASARRVLPPNPPLRRVSREYFILSAFFEQNLILIGFVCSSVVNIFPRGFRNMSSIITEMKEVDDSGKPETPVLVSSANTMEPRSTTGEFFACYGEIIDSKRDTLEKTTDSKYEEEFESWDVLMARYPLDGVFPLDVLPRSGHRDGSIYGCRQQWAKDYRVADRRETVFEAMMFTEPKKNCFISNGTCMWHIPGHTFQFSSIKVAKIHLDGGPAALNGYIAVRDNLDPLLNYTRKLGAACLIVKFSRDDPIIVEQGSFISLAGPKRGIQFYDSILIEYDMRIKTVDQEKHDLQLIDGISMIHNRGLQNCQAFTNRIHGDCGAVDIMS